MKSAKGPNRIKRFFTFFSDGVYRAVAAGPLGRLFGSYDRADRYFHKTAVVRAAQPKHSRYRATTLRGRIATAMEKSVLRRGAYGLMEGFLRCSLRTVGAFFLTSGIYSALISWLIAVVWNESHPNGFYLFLALAIALFGTVLLFSDHSVGYAVYKGRLTGALLHSSLGVSSDAVREIPAKGKTMYAVAVPLGMLFGSATALTGPSYPALALLMLVITLIVLSTPEAGILLALITAPFAGFLTYGTLWLVLIVVLSAMSYMGKLLRGTRAFRMEIQDFAMLLLLVGTILTGVSAAGGSAVQMAGLSAILILAYFPAVNVLATPTWLLRCRWGLLFSSGAAALTGIVQFALALIHALQGVRGVSMETLGGAVRAGFADNAVFAYFMVLSFPFALHAFGRAKNAAHRATAGLCGVMLLAATVLTWAQSAWVALLVEVVVLILLCKKQSFPYVLLGLLLLPVTLLFLPAQYRATFFAFFAGGNMTTGTAIASNVFYAGGGGFFGNAAGTLRLLFGFGANGLNRVCVLYGISNTASLSFWWVRLFEGGVLGVLLPALFLFFLLQNCFSILPHGAKTQSAVAPASGISMIAGVLLLSFFDDAWRDPAALLLFVLLCAIITADARHRRSLYVQPESTVQTPTFAEREYRTKKARGKQKNAMKEAVADESK